MAKQGRCLYCQLRYTWEIDTPLSEMYCLNCRRPLSRTTYLAKDQVIHMNIKKAGKCDVCHSKMIIKEGEGLDIFYFNTGEGCCTIVTVCPNCSKGKTHGEIRKLAEKVIE